MPIQKRNKANFRKRIERRRKRLNPYVIEAKILKTVEEQEKRYEENAKAVIAETRRLDQQTLDRLYKEKDIIKILNSKGKSKILNAIEERIDCKIKRYQRALMYGKN